MLPYYPTDLFLHGHRIIFSFIYYSSSLDNQTLYQKLIISRVALFALHQDHTQYLINFTLFFFFVFFFISGLFVLENIMLISSQKFLKSSHIVYCLLKVLIYKQISKTLNYIYYTSFLEGKRLENVVLYCINN